MRTKTKRPTIIVNVAMTADGKLDTAERKGAQISSIPDNARVDKLRASVDAIMVGGRTLLDEDPKLTVKSIALREERGALGLPKNPAKVGVVSQFSAGDAAKIARFLSAGPAAIYLYTTSKTPQNQISLLKQAGAEVFVLGKERVDLTAMMESLAGHGIGRLLVEGGGTLLSELFRQRLVDEINIYVAPRIFGGSFAPTLADGGGFTENHAVQLRLESVERFDPEGGIIIRYTIADR